MNKKIAILVVVIVAFVILPLLVGCLIPPGGPFPFLPPFGPPF